MRTLLLFALASLAAVPAVPARAQQAPAAAPARTVAAPHASELSAAERALAAASREAIIKTGLSAAFFDGHFRVARVIDRAGDRRVVWRLSVGGYETSVNDALGFYTEGARRVDTHSVVATLNATSDITRTITRRRAETLMRRCIGRFVNPQVEYRAQGAEGRAALLFTAQSTVPREREGRVREARERREREEREEHEREERERRARAEAGGGHAADVVEEDDEGGEGPVIMLGAVNLVTGDCSVGYGQAGPVPPKVARPRAKSR